MEQQDERRIWQRRQLRQTLIGTGVVGAVIGVAPLLLAFVLGSGRVAMGGHARPLSLLAVDAVLFVVVAVVFCMVVFGLLPMAVQYAFIRGARWWTGRD
ncbi:hypothetical protein [Pseudoxanthomonas japonensis]|jgi:hypothetical protein|uniref:Transmembrane protein n=1 Tax=Pseudoxanthomonas japonensis TaxID=69284 RepID=A0ABQ6ZMA2_9GAMM|nr:hypothetical protein [Pseudoxanthomonas japonensis]KAF1727437.1 hypothetical protein CSC78_01070 [Pseudoxanthomonas japonensis]